MAAVHRSAGEPTSDKAPYVPLLGAEEQDRSDRELRELLSSWETEGDEREQKETMAVLREALGARRVASSRNLFP
jgi:hypothetical protein